ncbi:hypothetical protein [Polaribacter septentrionalilitoris]|uniref:hypothetical protein n=1 Tax=Polaribacter septentrionalilitoris TaxID=2494657 RepID=UPI00135B9EC9|nr:hypothetical protein [Polaribacter septentrionalilitoris]
MKKIVLVLGIIFLSTSAFAQKRNDLKGPEFKNFKVWESTAEPTVVYVGSPKKGLKGPAFKNFKPWQKNNKNATFKVLNIQSTKPKLKGPAFKNQKPWQKNKKTIIKK